MIIYQLSIKYILIIKMTTEECIICYEQFLPNETCLDCNHWIHVSCVQKSADALQDIRALDGYPPIYDCKCPVCKVPVKGLIPKNPPSVPVINDNVSELFISHEQINSSMANWIIDNINNIDNNIPLRMYLWNVISDNHPNYDNEMLIYMSEIIENELMGN